DIEKAFAGFAHPCAIADHDQAIADPDIGGNAGLDLAHRAKDLAQKPDQAFHVGREQARRDDSAIRTAIIAHNSSIMAMAAAGLRALAPLMKKKKTSRFFLGRGLVSRPSRMGGLSPAAQCRARSAHS